MHPTVVTEKIENIGDKLMDIQQFTSAADLFLMAKMPERAVAALVEAQEWAKVQRVNF